MPGATKLRVAVSPASSRAGDKLRDGAGEERLEKLLGGQGGYGCGFGDCSRFSLDFIKQQLARNPRKLL